MRTSFSSLHYPVLIALAGWFLAAGSVEGQATLTGYARLPADSFREGPPCSNQLLRFWRPKQQRWDRQPVQGISSLRFADDSTFWALSDNGFGIKANSSSYLLCIYRLRFKWKTAEGGPGEVEVVEVVELKDRSGLAGFKIVRDRDGLRRLTGADFDPESLELGLDGSFWIGEEFGPYLLHFSRDGNLLSPPYSAVVGDGDRLQEVKSADRPGWQRANLRRSRGFEGMARNPHSGVLHLILEGSLKGEAPDKRRLFEFMPGYPQVAAISWRYPVEHSGHGIGELSYWQERGAYLVIERDWRHGSRAAFKRIYTWRPELGAAVKEEIVDLLNIRDPHLIATEDSLFTLPYLTIEAVQPIDDHTILICNDNNYPAVGGRTTDRRDDTEFILVEVEFPEGSR
jgi:glycerophosphoryl diester phosphodiesterase